MPSIETEILLLAGEAKRNAMYSGSNNVPLLHDVYFFFFGSSRGWLKVEKRISCPRGVHSHCLWLTHELDLYAGFFSRMMKQMVLGSCVSLWNKQVSDRSIPSIRVKREHIQKDKPKIEGWVYHHQLVAAQPSYRLPTPPKGLGRSATKIPLSVGGRIKTPVAC